LRGIRDMLAAKKYEPGERTVATGR
jgi:hypothetical protein